MRTGRAFVAGVIGGATMSVLMWLARVMGMEINLSMLLGTMIVLPPGPVAWITGFLVHLTISGLIALLYAWGFEHVTHRAGWSVGVGFSVVHAIVAGLVFGVVPAMHPLIQAGKMPAPGMFLANKGPVYIVAFFVLHAVYGAIVGANYGPVERARVAPPDARPLSV